MNTCSNIPYAGNAECGKPIMSPYGIKSFSIEKTGDIIIKYEVTVTFYSGYTETKTYLNIEDFYAEYNIKFN